MENQLTAYTELENFGNGLRIEDFTPNREDKWAPIFAVHPYMSSFNRIEYGGSSGPAPSVGLCAPRVGRHSVLP